MSAVRDSAPGEFCVRCGREGHTSDECKWPSSLQACMGGFCDVRDDCEHHTQANRRHVVERACIPGFEVARSAAA